MDESESGRLALARRVTQNTVTRVTYRVTYAVTYAKLLSLPSPTPPCSSSLSSPLRPSSQRVNHACNTAEEVTKDVS